MKTQFRVARFSMTIGSEKAKGIMAVRFPRERLWLRRRAFSGAAWLVLVNLFGCLALVGKTAGQAPPLPRKIPTPIDEVLRTKDGVNLAVRYFPGANAKTTIPVLLLHGWKGKGSDLDRLARDLHRVHDGRFAVLVPDLRGHGASTEQRNGAQDASTRLDARKMGRDDFNGMLKYDLETAKSYLKRRHAKEELNLDALAVVGSEVGALLALHWTAIDWSWPEMAGIKQGQDVKAIALLSPSLSFKGITSLTALQQPTLRDRMPTLLLYGGQDSKSSSVARRFESAMRRSRKSAGTADSFVTRSLKTSLQGAQLFGDKQLAASGEIIRFLDAHVAVPMGESFPWKPRGKVTQ